MAILFATSETVTADSPAVDVGGRTLSVFAFRTTNFVGRVEIQGRINADSEWHRARYWVSDPDTLSVTGPFIDPIIPDATDERHYYVFGPWRSLRASKTHGSGTIEVDHFASPLDPSYLFAGAAIPAGATEVTQSDPDAMQMAANLKVGLEDVDGFNPVPVSLVDIGELKEALARLEPGAQVTVSIEIPGIAAGDALDANDAIGIKFFLPAPKVGAIMSATLIDPDDDTLALTAHLFERNFVAAASDAAFTIAPGDMTHWITSITFDTPIVDLIQGKVSRKASSEPEGDYYEAPEGGFWIQCSTTGVPNIAAGAMPILKLRIKVGRA